jgi:hypothetical protein
VFLVLQTFLLFVPARRSAVDAEVIATSIAATAALWTIASILLIGASAAIRFISHAVGHPTDVDLWTAWIQPALKTTQVTETDLVPAFVMNILGVLVGFVGSAIITTRRGRLRSLSLWHHRLDLTPRVWNWFLQEPTEGRLYRIRLSGGDQLIGQVAAYSINPDDDVQEILVELYSRGPKNGPTVAVTDAMNLLVSRSEIETVEQLRYAMQLGPNGLHLVAVDE